MSSKYTTLFAHRHHTDDLYLKETRQELSGKGKYLNFFIVRDCGYKYSEERDNKFFENELLVF